ncbi:MAG: 1,4-alpha-glucan branching protein GlgB [Paracoccaceae bacterium]
MTNESTPGAAPAIDPAEARALDEGGHGTPWTALGPRGTGPDRVVVALDPGADALWAEVDGDRHPLPRVHGAVFAGPVPGEGAYVLHARGTDGAEWSVEDAHRFGAGFGADDEHLLGEGTHLRLWDVLGAHPETREGVAGTRFAVWAPSARAVSVVGDVNHWNGLRHPMRPRGGTGVWELFVPGAAEGQRYKYRIVGEDGAVQPLKADPVGFGAEHPPATASVIRDLGRYGWSDDAWMAGRAARQARDAPISIYEVHLGSWRRLHDQGGRALSYREAARDLVAYARDMGFTHLEFLPVSEFPFDGSWGYQPVGLYAPTVRFGPPDEFRDLIAAAHDAGLGVLIDWVPGHFPADPHGLGSFDGTHLYEHADPREGFHPDWNTLIYNYGRREVAQYLVANALYWLDAHHVDGLRVDAVASMLYRDYSRKEGEWVPNRDGGRENYEAIALLQRMNREVYGRHAGIMTVAEESTAFPGVCAPVDHGGLGFGYKWNMGWMNDTLRYMEEDPVHRRYHHGLITGPHGWAYTENFVLPISHDEVVHGKGSMVDKMPGDDWQKHANLRAYYGYMWGWPGKKLLFMGCELGQRAEWNHDAQLDWDAASGGFGAGIQRLVRDLNHLYRDTPALHVRDCEPAGFDWVDGGDAEQSVVSFLRHGRDGDTPVLVACNFTPVPRFDFRLGVPRAGEWREILNTDADAYGGSGVGNYGRAWAEAQPRHGQPCSLSITLPPLSVVMFQAGPGQDGGAREDT